jgi:uncharacterized protein YceH (UPF0502 family)
MILDPTSLRVLGALMEKEMTTPENYPLSINSLIAACNQRSSREPVMDLAEDEVRQSLHILGDLKLVAATRDSRVPKYEHRARTVLNLRRDETAVLCLLLLRGPQTPGELRSRSERMFPFDDLSSTISTLERLGSRPQPEGEAAGFGEGPLTVLLPRQPGAREARYAHLLGDPAMLPSRTAVDEIRHFELSGTPAGGGFGAELQSLRKRVEELEDRLALLESRGISAPNNPVPSS